MRKVYIVDGHAVIEAEEVIRYTAEVFVHVPGEPKPRRVWIDHVFPDRPAAVAKAIQHCCDDIQKGYAASQALQLLRRDADAPDPDEVVYGVPDETGMPSPDEDSTSDLTRPDEGEPVGGKIDGLIHFHARGASACDSASRRYHETTDPDLVTCRACRGMFTAADIDDEFRPVDRLEPAGAGRVPAFQGAERDQA